MAAPRLLKNSHEGSLAEFRRPQAAESNQNPFFPATCASGKTLLSPQVWALPARGGLQLFHLRGSAAQVSKKGRPERCAPGRRMCK